MEGAAPSSGPTIGKYRILARIGAGGMGEVFRARDDRLNRDVAIKMILPECCADPASIRRFEQEARALAALNHPNLLAIYEIGTNDGLPYIVSELLEGETLRTRLIAGALSLHRAAGIAIQIVRALVAAHEKGIVHCDLKPDNVFLTNDGHVKILDFGLAKLALPERIAGPATNGETVTLINSECKLGTVGYMSPEQVRGLPVDYRSDIFSFGAIFYEMLTRKRAFAGQTTADILSATLKDEPDNPCENDPKIPPVTFLIIRHCLEKRPDDRFQSARDLLFDIESLTSLSAGSLAQRSGRIQAPSRKPLWWVLTCLVSFVVLAIGLFLAKPASRPLPSYSQVTFRRGRIWSARFTADGNTVVYSASWDGNPSDIFSARPGSPESRSLGITDTDLLSVSSKGELAILLDRKDIVPGLSRGVLARLPLGGGAPREIVKDVEAADWSPDGMNLAIVRYVNGEEQLEFPVGKALFRTSGWLTDPRVSPAGDQVAFMEHGSEWDDRGWVSMVDLSGHARRLTQEFSSEKGLAWSPNGDEIWFTATRTGGTSDLYAVTLQGKERMTARVPTRLRLHDIARDGTVLLSSYRALRPVIALPPGQNSEQYMSVPDQISLFDLSNDGRTFLFQYYGEGSGANYSSYLGKTDGSPAVRLGDGASTALSPDGKWAITIVNQPSQTLLLPTGAGDIRALVRNGIASRRDEVWMPDGNHVIFTGQEPGKPPRCYIQEIGGGKPEPFGPEGASTPLPSPDGRFVLVRMAEERWLIAAGGGEPQPVRGLDPEDKVIRWSGDSRWIYVYRVQRPMHLYAVDPVNGRRQLLRQIEPSDPAGITGGPRLLVSGDGKSYLYSFERIFSDLYIAKNLLR